MQKAVNMHDSMPGTTVCALLKSGDNRSLNVLLAGYFLSVLHYGSKFTKDCFLIGDLIQDLFLEFLEQHGRLGGRVSVKNYLFKCLQNNLIRALKLQGIKEQACDNEDVFVQVTISSRF